MTKRLYSLSRRRFVQAGAGSVIAASLLRPSAFAQTARAGGTLKVSVTLRADSLNPLRGAGSQAYLLSELLYSNLTKIAPDLKAMPDLATAWEANGDATEHVFKLRQGARFKNGDEVTSADVVATIKAILNPETASPARAGVGPIEDVVAVDKYMVKFILKGPYADLPIALAHQNARIVPASVLASDATKLETEDFGSGPFQLNVFDPGRLVSVRKNPNYYNPALPHLDALELIQYPDSVAEIGALENGETDVMLTVNPPQFPRLEALAGVSVIRQQTGGFLNLVLRTDQKPFDDVRVRKALSLTLDRQALVDLVLDGYGRPAYDSFISTEYQYHADTGSFAPNIAEAKTLLAQAGYPQGLKVTLFAANNPPQRTQLGVAVKSMARPAGFDIDVQTIPMDNYIANVWRKANFYVGNWQMLPTQDAQYTRLLTTDAALGDTAWNNAKFDGLVGAARRTVDPAERQKIYTEAQKLIVAEVPYIVPFFKDAMSAHRSYVKGYIVHPLIQPHLLEHVWLTEDAPRRG